MPSHNAPGWLCLSLELFVLAAIVVVVAAAALASKTSQLDTAMISNDTTDDDGETPEGESRMGKGGLPLSSGFPWLMPLFCVDKKNDGPTLDSYFCGMGIRLTDDLFLASTLSVAKILDTLSRRGWGLPGVFNFSSPLKIDIRQGNQAGYEWEPEFKKMYAGNIGLFRISKRVKAAEKAGRDVKTLKEVKQVHPLGQRPPLASYDYIPLWDCRVIVYGQTQTGASLEVLSLKEIHVKRGTCSGDHLCRMEPNTDSDSVKAGKNGTLCGIQSDLGAPVICGLGEDSRITHIVSYVETHWLNGPAVPYCNSKFKVLPIANLTAEILKDVEKFIK